MDDKLRFEKFLQMFNKPENQVIYDFLHLRFDNNMPSGPFGIIRHEIRNCLTFGMFQAAITLTNHYMERFLKVALINSGVTVKMNELELFTKQRKEGIKKYASKNLGENIESAFKLMFITDKEKEALLFFKKYYRNTFSHFDHQKLIPKGETELYSFSFDAPTEKLNQFNMDNAVLTIDMGHTDYEFAKANARNYFLAIDDMAMRYELKRSPNMIAILKERGFDVDIIFNQFKFDSN